MRRVKKKTVVTGVYKPFNMQQAKCFTFSVLKRLLIRMHFIYLFYFFQKSWFNTITLLLYSGITFYFALLIQSQSQNAISEVRAVTHAKHIKRLIIRKQDTMS